MGSSAQSISAHLWYSGDFEDTGAARLMRVGHYFPSGTTLYDDAGNDVLYHFCETYPLPSGISNGNARGCEETGKLESIFAAKLWLIGRSYAASPERYSYNKKSSRSTKPKENDSEGYESFFKDIARILFEGCAFFRDKKADIGEDLPKEARGQFNDALAFIKELSGKSYKLDGCLEDAVLLEGVSKAVGEFGSAIQLARTVRDKAMISLGKAKELEGKDLAVSVEDQSSPLSFSSKFLHFHNPRLVFICDSISSGRLGSKRPRCSVGEDGGFAIDASKIGLSSGQDRYYVHALKELALATAVNVFLGKKKDDGELQKALEKGRIDSSEGLPCYFSITRMIDALVTNSVSTNSVEPKEAMTLDGCITRSS